MVQPKSRETVGDKVLRRGRPRVDAEPTSVGAPQCAKLYRDERLVAPIPQGPANEQLVVSGAVVVAGVEQVDAGVEGGVDGGDALSFIGRSVHAGHPHAPKRQRRDDRTGGAEPTRLF